MQNQKLKDFEILKQIVNNKIQIEDLDDEVKIRLIELCKKQIDVVNKRIEEIKSKNSCTN